jgi:hypothetical protein
MMNVSSIMIKTIVALVLFAALISTRFGSEVGHFFMDGISCLLDD